MPQPVKISVSMRKRFEEMGYSDDQIKEIVPILTHAFIPVQRISDMMRETTQVGFNFHKDESCQWMELVDPWNLLELGKTTLPIHLPLPEPVN